MDQFLLSDLLRLILSILGLIIFNLGLYGFFEKHLLLDKSEKEKIKNTWISRLVVEKKKK
jgi:hypothetical protein